MQVLKKFNFGETFMTWVKILFQNRKSCVKNGGHVSNMFEVQTGVRQGCPLAPFIFILAAEILAQNIVQSENIKGIKVEGKFTSNEIKIRQFADDTTFFVRSEIDIREILSRLKVFSKISGLVINEKKCKIMPMNQKHNHNLKNLGFEVTNKIKIVGVVYSNEMSACHIEENWVKRIDKSIKILSTWMKFNLSYLGKILIIKTLILSQFTFLIQSITLPDRIIKDITTLCFRFLWRRNDLNKKGWERVKRDHTYRTKQSGGLEMINFAEFQNSFLINWAKELLEQKVDDFSVPLVFFQSVGGLLAFESNLKPNEFEGIDTIKSKFWKKVLITWLEYKDSNDKYPSDNSLIHNNKHVKFKGKILFQKRIIDKNIVRIKDMLQMGSIIPFNIYCEKIGQNADNLLTYNVLYNAISKIIREPQFSYDSRTDDAILINDKNVYKMSRKDIYKCLTNIGNPDKNFDHWRRNYNVSIGEEHWRNIFECTKEPKLQTLQWKIIHNIYPTNVLLNRIGLSHTEKCLFCQETDNIQHFFMECMELYDFWRSVINTARIYIDTPAIFTEKDFLLGVTKDHSANFDANDTKTLNSIFIIAKFAISKFKVDTSQNLKLTFETEMALRGL